MNKLLLSRTLHLLVAGIALQAMSAAGFGQIVAYEGFLAGTDSANGEYLPGGDGRYIFTGQNPVLTGFTGAWTTATASFELGSTPLASLSYTDSFGNSLLTSGNAAFRRFTQGTSARALNIPGLSSDGTTTYFSFLMKLDDATALGRMEFGESATANSAGLRIRADGTNFIASVNFASTTLAAANTNTQFFVFKVDFGVDDTWSLWMNPSDLTNAGAPTLTGTVTGPASLDLTHLVLMRDAGGTAGNGFIVDEVRVGTTWADVAVVVPEPSTYALLAGLLTLCAVAVRRRTR